jgi:glycosidase
LLAAGTDRVARAAPVSANNLVYQVFVRSWADTPDDPDEIGDLRGLRQKLDYLNDGDTETDDDLEAGILWLMPIFPSPSYHGYDVTDYQAVNPDYGTMQDFDYLIAAAHRRGVRIVLDLPVNHTSVQHPWFKQAVDDPASHYRAFYHFADADQPAPPGRWHVATGSRGQKVRFHGLFSQRMPDLDFENPEVREEMKAIARFWLEKGADGFRLDAAKHIYGFAFGPTAEADLVRNNLWWQEFSESVYRVNPGAVLIGEVMGDPETLRRHAFGLDGLLDAPFLPAARARIAFPGDGFLRRERGLIEGYHAMNQEAHRRAGALLRDEPFQPYFFLSSHDHSPRLASYLEETRRQGMQPTVDEAYRLGMYVLLSIGPCPILYYGDELMQPGFKWNGNPPDGNPPGDGSRMYDETLREPFPWHKAGDDPANGDGDMQTAWSDRLPRFERPNDGVSVEEQALPGQMLHLVRGLTHLRAQHPGYANGELGAILTDSRDWLVFEKVTSGQRYLVLINTTGIGMDYRFHQGWFPRYVGAQVLFWSDGQKRMWKNETGQGKTIDATVFVPGYGMVVLRQVPG